MPAPAYLVRSRHGVFYLRWPLPPALHPQGKRSDVKLSLRTRDRREALRSSRLLGYVADKLIGEALASDMRYDDLQALVRRHFQRLLDERLEDMNARGPLDTYEATVLSRSLSLIETPDGWELHDELTEGREGVVERFQALYGLALEQGSRERGQLSQLIHRGHTAFLRAVRDHNNSLGDFSFDVPQAITAPDDRPTGDSESSLSVRELVVKYLEEGERAASWTVKTRGEKEEHFALLFELVGDGTSLAAVTPSKARELKDVLFRYPKNRNKNPLTRGLPLDQALAVPDVDRIGVKTINTYLAAYSTLFAWAKRNGYVEQNPFVGLSVRDARKRGAVERQPFSKEQCAVMLEELCHNRRGLISKDYQKWGPLIGLYTGARLGEIAQLRLQDVRQQDGLWCFDLNDEDGKSLKTESSKRLVPVHSELVRHGFLDHVDALRGSGKDRLFESFTYCPKNGWGRALGRWFNDRFLDRLGMKSPALVFHSFRHTMVTRLSQADVPEPLVKALVGHSRQGVTQQHYFRQGYTLRQLSEALARFEA